MWLKDNFYNSNMKFTMPIYKNYVGIKILQERVFASKPNNSTNKDDVNLSSTLGLLLGGSRMSKNQVLNRLRSYIQTGQLQNFTTGIVTSDNRFLELFGKKNFKIYELEELIKPHIF
jgi:chromatin remodeling complex protein RSC6